MYVFHDFRLKIARIFSARAAHSNTTRTATSTRRGGAACRHVSVRFPKVVQCTLSYPTRSALTFFHISKDYQLRTFCTTRFRLRLTHFFRNDAIRPYKLFCPKFLPTFIHTRTRGASEMANWTALDEIWSRHLPRDHHLLRDIHAVGRISATKTGYISTEGAALVFN